MKRKNMPGCKCCGCFGDCASTYYTSMDWDWQFSAGPCASVGYTLGIGDTIQHRIENGSYPSDCMYRATSGSFWYSCFIGSQEYRLFPGAHQIGYVNRELVVSLPFSFQFSFVRLPNGYGDPGASLSFEFDPKVFPAGTDCADLLSPVEIPLISVSTSSGTWHPGDPVFDKLLWNLNL